MSQENASKKRALNYLKVASTLEKNAIRRYKNHIKMIKNPDINALLEGILRTEERHLKTVTENIKLLEK